MTAPAAPLTGQDIAEAEGAVMGLLEAILTGEEVSPDEYVMLHVVTLRPGMTPTQAYDFFATQRQLRRNKGELVERMRDLAGRGLVTGLEGDGPVQPTPRGAQLHATLSGRVAEVTRRLYDSFDQAELARTKQTLSQVAARAHELRRELVA